MGRSTIVQCRLWWPQHLSRRPACNMLLIGWVAIDTESVDLVIATACTNSSASSNPFLQAMVNCATSRLPNELQGKAKLSVIGECVSSSGAHFEQSVEDFRNSPGQLLESGFTDCNEERPGDSGFWLQGEPGCSSSEEPYTYHCDKWRKGRVVGDGTFFPGYLRPRNGYRVGHENKFEGSSCRSIPPGTWIELRSSPTAVKGNAVDWVPIIRSLKACGSFCIPNFHLILYEQPKLASHHFSIRPWNSVSEVNCMRRNSWLGQEFNQTRPEWVAELAKQQEAPDIDLVILQLNCAAAVEQVIDNLRASLDTSCKRPSLSSIFLCLYRHFIAATVALLASVFYLMVQAGSCLLSIWPLVFVKAFSAKVMRHTHRNICIRCYEITGWPVILLWRGCGRDQPNIEAAHRAALVRHSVWSAIIFDLFFGVVGGAFFLYYLSSISQWVRCMVRSLTDDILRTGCIWLMGVPAGFKLNTELAGRLGLVSLNVIQVWSTLLYLLKPVFGPLLCMLAISGMVLGITVPAAIITDVLFIATCHISALYQLVAFLYSNQLQALAALWRLFRGRKRNYLRGRIDTYDYSVEQHVVGSLMFTPLLLLLPTTSVFYIFFTILYTSLSILRFLLQIFVAFLHFFPYAQVVIWLVQPRRLPSGIVFENLTTENIGFSSKVQGVSCQPSCPERDFHAQLSGRTLISLLGVKTANLDLMNGQERCWHLT